MNNNEQTEQPLTVKPALLQAVVSRSFESILQQYILNKESMYQLQYYDYNDNEWTVPLLLTPKRASEFIEDKSVKKIRIKYRTFEFDLNVP